MNKNEITQRYRKTKKGVLTDAKYFLGMKSNGNISECLKGNRSNVKGYTFKFEHPHLLEEDTQ